MQRSNQTRYEPHPDVVYKELEREYILVNLKTDRIFSLNATGSLFWRYLLEDQNLEQIAARIEEEYEIDHQALMNEIETLVEKLLDERMLIIPD